MKTTVIGSDAQLLESRERGLAVRPVAMTAQVQQRSWRPHAPSVDRAAIGYRFTLAKNQLELLSAMNTAAALIDRGGGVCLVNQLAKVLLGPDIMVRGCRLTACDYSSNKRLQALIEAALDLRRPLARLAPVVVLRRDRRPLIVSALCVIDQTESADDNYAILLLTDPESRSLPDFCVLQEAFGLTHAEARLSRLLAVGESLECAAASLGITKGTASQRLKSIFAKTETHRQGELVSLLSSLI